MSRLPDPQTVTLTIDGRSVTVPKGITILRAAETVGVKIAHYCYHPGLSSPAMCRLCLVEVEGWPKLAPSCKTAVADGQVVYTDSEKARAQRTGVLEFYLVNHPLDCPICDQSGECKLQDYVSAEGRVHGRSREPKRVFGRDDFGGDVLFYGDRCVMCTRCVRFMREVARDDRLCIVDRGSRSIIDTFFEKGLEGSPFAGNIVDICPVGALVSKDFLHKARAWDLDHTPSVCPSCSQGCNISVHTRDNLVQRLKPRENLEVNGWWMCDYGRFAYQWLNRRDRLSVPVVDGKAVEWSEAVKALADALQAAGGQGKVKAVCSPMASNEDMGFLKALVGVLGGGEIFYRSRRAPDEIVLPGYPILARRRDLVPNARGAEIQGMIRIGDDMGQGGLDRVAQHEGVLLVLGDPLTDQGEEFGSRAAVYVYFGNCPSPAAAQARFVLPIVTFAECEGTWINVQGRIQRFWPALRAPGDAQPAWRVLGSLLEVLGEAPAPTLTHLAFEWVARRTPVLEGISYQDIGTRGTPLRDPALVSGD